jgi:hypothetical protein
MFVNPVKLKYLLLLSQLILISSMIIVYHLWICDNALWYYCKWANEHIIITTVRVQTERRVCINAFFNCFISLSRIEVALSCYIFILTASYRSWQNVGTEMMRYNQKLTKSMLVFHNSYLSINIRWKVNWKVIWSIWL